VRKLLSRVHTKPVWNSLGLIFRVNVILFTLAREDAW
jgi:hypothetical protein